MAHFPPTLHTILTCNSIIKLGCNIKQALLDIALAYNDPEINLSLRSNPAILELGQHAKLKGFSVTSYSCRKASQQMFQSSDSL